MIYISFVGNHDRWNPDQEISGAMRTIFARYEEQIAHVFLLHAGVKPHFNYLETAEKTARWMSYRNPGVQVNTRQLDIENPIDYDLVYHVMYEQMMQIMAEPTLKEMGKLINITSGTPTMTACWVLLQKSGLIPNARLVQSFAPELAKNGRSNVLEVDLEIDNFPQITAPGAIKATLNRTSQELRVIKQERDTLDLSARFPRIAGHSPAILDIKDQIRAEINEESSVLIVGERGTGKQLIAEAIWEEHHKPLGAQFHQIDCSGIGDETFISELFGHEKGAFTGATTKKTGFIEQDPNGVIFLDEIGNLSLENQSALLWYVQDGKYRPLGSNQIKHGTNCIIAATNVDVNNPVLFKNDLLDRFDIIVKTPALRDHMEDFDLLLDYLVPNDLVLSESVRGELKKFSWPGNVRSLKKWLIPIINRYGKKEEILEWHHLPQRLHPGSMDNNHIENDELPNLPLNDSWDNWTSKVRFKALKQSGDIQEKAAILLGMKGDTFRKWMKGKWSEYESWKNFE